MVEQLKDVFVIHSKREPLEEALVARLIAWLGSVAIPVYEYSDWEWSRRERGKPRYASAGTDLDPVRFAMGHPEPFRCATWDDVPDRQTLDEMLGHCRVVLFIAPRSGSPSAGVSVESEVLPDDPALVVATWGEHTDWVAKRHRPGVVYRITGLFDPQQEAAALDLAHLAWAHWVIDHLARECGQAGRGLLRHLAATEPGLRRCIRFAAWVAGVLGKPLPPGAGDAERAEAATPATLGTSLAPAEARPVIAFWHGRACLAATLPPPRDRDVAALVRRLRDGCEALCEAAIAAHPALVADRAEALRTSVALGQALGHADWARDRLGTAIALADLPDAVRSRLLADRAAARLRESPATARADIEAVLALQAADPAARAQALWLRARAVRRTDPAAAAGDLTAALEIIEAPVALAGLCLHDRAMIFAGRRQAAQALADLDRAVLLRGLPAAIAAPARLDRAVLRGEQGDVEGELADYTEVLAMAGVPAESRLKAHMYRGLTRRERGDRLGATEDFVVVRDDPESPPDARRAAIGELGALDPLAPAGDPGAASTRGPS